ncbi:hypothetical protein [Sphingosinicella microcystinivorans]|uniref:hypothetical protein n=1 Tax=Sphingosinicella microcystinivorans TaxID=335406 RepID=UPI000F83581F|nr:hypothetical protein [Sphingosinicella microcystinivorans]
MIPLLPKPVRYTRKAGQISHAGLTSSSTVSVAAGKLQRIFCVSLIDLFDEKGAINQGNASQLQQFSNARNMQYGVQKSFISIA